MGNRKNATTSVSEINQSSGHSSRVKRLPAPAVFAFPPTNQYTAMAPTTAITPASTAHAGR